METNDLGEIYMRRKIRNKKNRWIALLLACVMGITFVAPVTVLAKRQEEITVMSNIGEEIMQPYLDAFEQKYPNIKVKYYYYSDYESSMAENLEKGSYGDVLFVPSFMTSEQYPQYLEKLGNYQELSEKYNYMETSKFVNDVVYGIPSSAYLAGILYNKEVFNKAGITENPKSIEEFMQDLHMIQNRTDSIPFYTNYSSQWTLQFWETFPYLEMTGDPEYRNNKFIYERNPFSKGSTHYQVYGMLYDIVKDGLCEDDPKSDDWEKSKGMLNNGQIGCMAIGSWAVKQFKDAGKHGDSVAFMPFPNMVDGKQYVTISTDYNYAINTNSEHKEAARAYIDFMLDESGYALDQECLSVVKTDPYPEAYGNMDNIVLSSNSSATSINYSRWESLSKDLNMEDNTQAARVIEAAAGYSDESFDDIVEDWNTRWESGRPADMESEMEDDTQGHRFSTIVSEDYQVDLSLTEKVYIKDIDQVQVGYLCNLAPFQYEGEQGFSGLSRQICDIICETTGLKFNYVPYESQDKLLEALQNGDIQIAAGLDSNSVGEAGIRFSKSYIDYMEVIVKNDSISIDELDNKKEAYVAGNETGEEQIRDTKRVKKHSLSAAIAAVDSGKADYTTGNYFSVDYYIKDLESEHVSVVPMSDKGSMSLAFSKGADSRIISICNKCLYAIPESRIQVMLMENLDPPAKKITVGRFIRANPLLAAGMILAVFAVIGVAVFTILRQRLVSARKHAVDVKRYEILATLMDEYVFEYDTKNKQMHFDPKFLGRFGIQGDVDMMEYSDDNKSLQIMLQEFAKMRESGEQNSRPFEIPFEDGSSEWYRLVVYAVPDEHGMDTHMIGKLVSAQKEMEEQRQIRERAQRDPLTGLYNRDGFTECFEAVKETSSIAFAVMDIDNFKSVNDQLGHAGGDEALKALADNMSRIFDRKAVLCRYGGDEFILCIFDMDREQVEQLLERLVRSMDYEMDYHGNKKHLSISLGAVYGSCKQSQKQLFQAADEVLYQVKEYGKNNWSMKNLEQETL